MDDPYHLDHFPIQVTSKTSCAISISSYNYYQMSKLGTLSNRLLITFLAQTHQKIEGLLGKILVLVTKYATKPRKNKVWFIGVCLKAVREKEI